MNYLKKTFLAGIVFLLFFISVNASILLSTRWKIIAIDQAQEQKQAAIILGARVFSSGALSHILQDRVETGISLYEQGLVQKLLVSGDNGQENYDEVNAVKDYLLSRGIPEEVIFLDHAGFDTYDSMYRAQAVFQVESAYIVTQDFHLPRAVFLAKNQGIESTGIIANRRAYRSQEYSSLREWFARMKSYTEDFFDLRPQFLGDVISITGDGRASWD